MDKKAKRTKNLKPLIIAAVCVGGGGCGGCFWLGCGGGGVVASFPGAAACVLVLLVGVFACFFLRVFALCFCAFWWYTCLVGWGAAVVPFGCFFCFCLGVFVVSVRSSRVSSVLRGVVLLLPGFSWSPAGGRVGSASRRWVPVWSGVGLPSAPAPVAPVAPVASACGSALFLSSAPFLSAVASGSCPVALSLRVFRWPLRSAVLGSLVRVLASPRVRSFVVSSPACRSAVSAFVRAAVASLGFSVSGRFASRRAAVSSFCLRLARSASVPSFFVSGVSSSALVAAFRSLSRCLRWLSSRSPVVASCPPALRGLLSRLVFLLLPLA